jgi:LuxR family maltose regulon positive regulatory protein/serine/threonine-protein kinase PknK
VPLDASTRLRPPTHVGNVVARRRLIEMLREGRDRQLTVIHAPAGYGKTTLAVQWLHDLSVDGATVAWLGLHGDDNVPHWFLSRLLLAVARVLPAEAQDLRDLAQLVQEGDEDTRTYVLSVLLDRIGRHDRRFVLTLDDWHVIHDPAVHRGLVQLLDFAPANLLLILTSRALPRLPLSRLRVRRQLTEVDADGLRFDADEAWALLVDLDGLDLDRADVAQLCDSTDGWVAALQLASLSLRGCADPKQLIRGFSGRHHAVEEYLAENVLSALPADVLDFLLDTSVCDRLCGDLAGTVSGRSDGQAMLEELVRRDLFLRPLDTERTWFRYHHLFADHLRRRLSRDRPGRARGLHARASAWFAGQDLVPEAVTHALAAGDVTTATDLVEGQAMLLVEHSRMVGLLGLVGRLPAGAADGRPGLLMAVAWANCLLHRTSAAQLALDRLQQEDLPEEARSEADVVQACIDVYCDRTDRAEDLVRRSLQQAAHYRPWIVAVAANLQSFCDIQAARYQAARDRQRWARPFQDRATGPFSGVYGRCLAGMAALAQLDLDAAQEQLQDAVSLARTSAGRSSHAARLAGALLGELLYERGELAEAERLLEESRELGAESGVVDVMVDSHVLLARTRAGRGAVTEASELLGDGARTAERLGLPRLSSAVHAERVRLLISARQVREARRAAQGLADGTHCQGGIAVALDQLRAGSWAAVLSAEGDHAAATTLLEGLVAELHARGQWRAEVAAMVQLAAVHDRAARWRAAERTLAGALVRGLPAGLWQTFLDADVAAVLDRLLALVRADAWPGGLDPLDADRLVALVTAHGRPDVESADLTGREVEVLRMLAAGRSNQQIAQSLVVTVNTVKWHLKNINVKLGAANRTEAVSLGRRSGLVS